MKTMLCACLIAVGFPSMASAAERSFDVVKLDLGVYRDSDAKALKSDVWWYSRYGKRCYHGPRYIRACH